MSGMPPVVDLTAEQREKMLKSTVAELRASLDRDKFEALTTDDTGEPYIFLHARGLSATRVYNLLATLGVIAPPPKDKGVKA